MNNHFFVVCAYKESPYLEECIHSLLSQTVKSNIVIVTSTMNEYLIKIAEKNNLSLYENKGDKGIGSDWNFAIETAMSLGAEFVTIAHQDDVYIPTFLSECKRALSKPETLMTFTDYCELREGQVVKSNLLLTIKRLLLIPMKLSSKKIFTRSSIRFGNPICCPSVTLNMKKMPDFRFNRKMTCSLDWEAWERISKMNGKVEFISRPLMHHRIHNLSETTNSIAENRRSDDDLEILSRFWGKNIAKLIFTFYKKSQKLN